MSYFSRLTDIVTCNLTEILAGEEDPQTAIREIISEMEEGLAGARRAVSTASASEDRIRKERDQHLTQVESLQQEARAAVSNGDEDKARLAILRKQESQDVIAGLEQQHEAATATFEHLTTTQRALEARLSDARRKLQSLDAGSPQGDGSSQPTGARGSLNGTMMDETRAQRIEAELDALKREINRDG